jgi:hypothetical protein
VEKDDNLQSILFIQTGIDLLKKYLPTICSRNLEISREKQIKILETFHRIKNFLLGDTVENLDDAEQKLPSKFSKELND